MYDSRSRKLAAFRGHAMAVLRQRQWYVQRRLAKLKLWASFMPASSSCAQPTCARQLRGVSGCPCSGGGAPLWHGGGEACQDSCRFELEPLPPMPFMDIRLIRQRQPRQVRDSATAYWRARGLPAAALPKKEVSLPSSGPPANGMMGFQWAKAVFATRLDARGGRNGSLVPGGHAKNTRLLATLPPQASSSTASRGTSGRWACACSCSCSGSRPSQAPPRTRSTRQSSRGSWCSLRSSPSRASLWYAGGVTAGHAACGLLRPQHNIRRGRRQHGLSGA